MNETIRDTILAFGVVAVIMAVGLGGMFFYSGQITPYSVVISGSMQHGDQSSVGVIDTGDVIVVRDLDKIGGIDGIRSYVDGYHENYSKFGEFGDVIIYERGGNQNAVIHRAILWLDWNGTSWDAPSLDGFPGWSVTSGNPDGTGMNGVLTMTEIGFSKKTVSLDLDTLPRIDGFATMGDSKKNAGFDQTLHIANGLIGENRIKYVAGFEIPWIGAIKMHLDGNPNVSQIPSNSIPNLVASMVCVIIAIIGLALVMSIASSIRKDHGDEED